MCAAPVGAPRISETRGPAIQPGTVADAVCCVDTGSGLGSGTCVYYDPATKTGIVITCRHVLERAGKEVKLDFRVSGAKARGAVMGHDKDHGDLAAIQFTAEQPILAIPIGATPAVNARLWVVGYPRGHGPFGRVGNFLRRAIAGREPATFASLEISFNTEPGDSGGGVFNERGQLVAVLWGGDGRSSQAVSTELLAPFVERCLGRLRGRAPAQQPATPKQPATQPPARPADPVPAATVPAATVPAPSAAVPAPALKEVKDALADVHRKLDALHSTVSGASAAIADVRATQALPNPVLDRLSRDVAVVKQVADVVNGTAGNINDRLGKVDELATVVQGVAGQVGASQGALASLPALAHALPWLAGASVATPGLGLIGLAGWGVSRLVRRKSGAAGSVHPIPATPDLAGIIQGAIAAGFARHTPTTASFTAQPTGTPTATMPPVVLQSAPAPQRTVTEPQYVTVTEDKSDAARAWARQQIATKYPGMVDAAEMFDQLVSQFINAQPQKG